MLPRLIFLAQAIFEASFSTNQPTLHLICQTKVQLKLDRTIGSWQLFPGQFGP